MPSTSPFRDLEVTRSGRLAVITIDRPDRRNALALDTMSEIVQAFDDLGADQTVWAILITGRGEQAFCAGADLKEADDLARTGRSYPHPMTGQQRNVFETVLECPKPTIAAINGVALGAGLELTLACDVRLAADHCRIGLPEATRGMGANFGSVLLPRLVPRAIAMDLLYTGRSIDAAEAMRIGLVNEVLPRNRFHEQAAAYGSRIAANAPLTLQRYKQMALKGWELSIHAALRLDVGPNPYASEDRVEGVRAFVEKRAPVWRGR